MKQWCAFLGLVLVASVDCSLAQTEEARPTTSPPLGTPPSSLPSLNATIQEKIDLPQLPTQLVEVTPPPLKVGDTVQLEVQGLESFGIEAGDEIQFKNLAEKDSFLKRGWHVVGKPEFKNGRLTAILSPLKPGELPLDQIGLNRAGENQAFAELAPQVLKVESVLVDQEGNKKDPPVEVMNALGLDFPWWVVMAMAVAGIIGVTAIVALLFWWWRNRRRREAPAARLEEPLEPEHVLALRALEDLRSKKYWESGQFKPHYFGVSEIIKVYVGRRYDCEAAESTTQELFDLVERQGMQEQQVRQLKDLFEHLDLIKFADQVPSQDQAQKIIDRAVEIVKNTKRIEPHVVDAV